MFRNFSMVLAGGWLVLGTLGCAELDNLPPITIGGGGASGMQANADPVQGTMPDPPAETPPEAPPVTPPATPPGGGLGSGVITEGPVVPVRPPTLRVSCASRVQDTIAWNYKGNRHWADTNVRRLCKGAEYSAHPAACFERVMHGKISWGRGDRWEWKNAIDLCEGTTNASTTISCFKSRISGGSSWQNAIKGCGRRVATRIRVREAIPAVSASPVDSFGE